jgi:hypothetical protein
MVFFITTISIQINMNDFVVVHATATMRVMISYIIIKKTCKGTNLLFVSHKISIR